VRLSKTLGIFSSPAAVQPLASSKIAEIHRPLDNRTTFFVEASKMKHKYGMTSRTLGMYLCAGNDNTTTLPWLKKSRILSHLSDVTSNATEDV
jgi:2-iminoacetate synthase ThiH